MSARRGLHPRTARANVVDTPGHFGTAALTDTALYLGIDGGATQCRARLQTAAGETIGEGLAGPANPRHGQAAACQAILAATHHALDAAALTATAVDRVHAGLGLAGVGQAADRRQFLEWAHPFQSYALMTDAEIACLGAHGGEDGAVIVLGTGSCGIAMVAGQVTRIGGWGFPVSDQASGAWIGLSAVRRALLAHDGIVDPTALINAVMTTFDNDPEQAVAWQSTAGPADYGRLAPLVFEHGGAGDAEAAAILRDAATDVAQMAERLRATGAPRLSLLGGLAEPIDPWLPDSLTENLDAPMGDPLSGALLLARRSCAR